MAGMSLQPLTLVHTDSADKQAVLVETETRIYFFPGLGWGEWRLRDANIKG
jgi:hypothetical protein